MVITIRDMCILAQDHCGLAWMMYDYIILPNDNKTIYKLGGGGSYFDETEQKWKDCQYLKKVIYRKTYRNVTYCSYESSSVRVVRETEVYIKFKGEKLVKTLEELKTLWYEAKLNVNKMLKY